MCVVEMLRLDVLERRRGLQYAHEQTDSKDSSDDLSHDIQIICRDLIALQMIVSTG